MALGDATDAALGASLGASFGASLDVAISDAGRAAAGPGAVRDMREQRRDAGLDRARRAARARAPTASRIARAWYLSPFQATTAARASASASGEPSRRGVSALPTGQEPRERVCR